MKGRYQLIFALTLCCGRLLAQAESGPTYTYTGEIVNANCYQAARIVNRNSRGNPGVRGASAFTRGNQATVPNASARQKKSILRHCSINPGTTAFALLNDDGNFLKLNEQGNRQVMDQTGPRVASPRTRRKIHVVVTGSVDRDTLMVKSVLKQ